MASDTMESAIMMEVDAIQNLLDSADHKQVDPAIHEAIEDRLASIRQTLNEGDPQPDTPLEEADMGEYGGER